MLSICDTAIQDVQEQQIHQSTAAAIRQLTDETARLLGCQVSSLTKMIGDMEFWDVMAEAGMPSTYIASMIPEMETRGMTKYQIASYFHGWLHPGSPEREQADDVLFESIAAAIGTNDICRVRTEMNYHLRRYRQLH